MSSVETRVDRLEEALMKLAYAQFNTEMEIRELKGEMLAFKNEMAEFKNEMAEFKNTVERETTILKKEMAEFRNALERDTAALKKEMADHRASSAAELAALKEEMDRFKENTDRYCDEARRERREMNKRWGEISNKMGTIVEDIIYPSARGIAREYFGAAEFEFEGQRIRRAHATLAGHQREFDGLFLWPGHVLLLEAKASVRPEYLKAFAAFVKDEALFDYFPEYRGRRVIPLFSALALTDEEVAWLTRHGLYAMAMGEDTMALLNGPQVDARRAAPAAGRTRRRKAP